MKKLTEPVRRTAPNALGQDSTSFHHEEQIEASDVGRNLPHHRGFGHSVHTIRASDIGKTITVYTDGTGWTCWMFKPESTT